MVEAQIQPWQTGTSPETLSAALFDGALIAVADPSPIAELARRGRELLRDCFDADDPESAEGDMPAAVFRAAVANARRAVERDTVLQGLWTEAQAALGYSPQEVLTDRLRLRVVPSRAALRGRRTSPLPPHRDTWGAGIPEQINWWMPLYPLAETRTMIIWPDAYGERIANTSGEWDFRALRRDGAGSYPLLPTASERPTGPGQPVLLPPGSLLAFSAAHLHASRADESGRSRFSLDTRSVWLRDLWAGRAAPDLDNQASEKHWAWFSRLSDGRSGARVIEEAGLSL